VKFLIDNNISFKLSGQLATVFTGTRHVRDELGTNASDLTVWQWALQHDFVILTKDNDFDEISQLKGCPPKVVHLNCGNKSTTYINNLLIRYEKEIQQFVLREKQNCIMKIHAL
jgi:predicted nuclease of predicted toxin-antitoxin system